MAIDLTSNCLLQLKMNDNTDSALVVDSSGSENHGYFAAQYTEDLHIAGKLNGALSFFGTFPPTCYIALTSLIQLSDYYTIVVWVYVDDNTSAPRYILGNGSNTKNYIYIQDNGFFATVAFKNDAATEVTWSGLSSLYHSWKMLTFVSVADGTKIHLFIDNVFQASKDLDTDFRIDTVAYGNNSINQTFKGYMDCLDIFDANLLTDGTDFLWNGGYGTENLSSAVRPLVCGSLVGNSLIGKGLV